MNDAPFASSFGFGVGGGSSSNFLTSTLELAVFKFGV